MPASSVSSGGGIIVPSAIVVTTQQDGKVEVRFPTGKTATIPRHRLIPHLTGVQPAHDTATLHSQASPCRVMDKSLVCCKKGDKVIAWVGPYRDGGLRCVTITLGRRTGGKLAEGTTQAGDSVRVHPLKKVSSAAAAAASFS